MGQPVGHPRSVRRGQVLHLLRAPLPAESQEMIPALSTLSGRPITRDDTGLVNAVWSADHKMSAVSTSLELISYGK